MANYFANDSRIIEFWRFENNLTAGKAGNDLTALAGGVGYNSSTPLEGTYSLDLETGSSQGAYRADTDLSAGFPLKNGDTTKKISCAFWIKPESLPGLSYLYPLISKWNAAGNARGFMIDIYEPTGSLRVSFGYNNGNNGETWTVFSGIFVASRKYHIGVAVDGVAKTALVRIWNDYTATATTYTHDYTNEMNVEDATLFIGSLQGGGYYYDGLIDEVVVSNAVLSANNFDQIRQGVFGAATSTVNAICAPVTFATAGGVIASGAVTANMAQILAAVEGDFVISGSVAAISASVSALVEGTAPTGSRGRFRRIPGKCMIGGGFTCIPGDSPIDSPDMERI